MGLVVAGMIFRSDAAEISLVAAAVNRGVTVQDFAPFSAQRQTDAIVGARHGREIQDGSGVIFAVARLPQK